MDKAMHKYKGFGGLLFVVQLVLTALFFVLLMDLNMLPTTYLVLVIVLLMILLTFTFTTESNVKLKGIAKVLALLVCIALSLGSIYLYRIRSMFLDIGSMNIQTSDIAVIVMNDDPAQNLAEAKDYLFGIQEELDREHTNQAMQKLNEQFNKEIATISYSDIHAQVQSLYRGDVQAIIINETYRDLIKETIFSFDERTRVLATQQIKSEVIVSDKDKVLAKDITQDPFMVYISGLDLPGTVLKTSRSDVNIIATINPMTKQILLTNTPRDYYIELAIAGWQMDKLTHAGMYGVGVSVKSLEALYDITIDYYVRVNFNSLTELVDTLGGIKVHSEYDFYSSGYHFVKGDNFLNGRKALLFSRERKVFAEGDVQRGNNQMAVIVGLIDKLTSPAILKNAGAIMKNLSTSFETNMNVNEMTSLIKMQLTDMATWSIAVSGVTGTPDSKVTYTYKTSYKYVTIPDLASVEAAKRRMKQVMGEGVQGQEKNSILQ